MLFTIFSYIINFIIFTSQIWFLKNFSSYSKSYNWKKFFLSLLLAILFSQFTQYFDYSTEENTKKWTVLFFSTLFFNFTSYFIISFYIYKNSFLNSIIAILICLIDLFLMQLFTSVIIIFIFPDSIFYSNPTQSLIYQFVSALFVFFTLRIIHRFFRKYHIQFLNKRNGFLTFILIILFISFPFILIPVISILTETIQELNKSLLLALLLIFLFFGDTIFCLITLKLIQKAQFELELNLLYEELQRELEYYKSINDNINQARKIRHDFNNQLQLAYTLFHQGSNTNSPIKQKNALSESFDSKLTSAHLPHFSDHTVLNFIIQNFYTYAQTLGITFEAIIDIPSKLKVEDLDLCSIFSNLLSNATRAAQKTPHPSISISTIISNHKLEIVVCNTTLQCDNEYRDPKVHGYGLLILSDLAKKYNGTFDTKQEKDIFTAYFSISLKE